MTDAFLERSMENINIKSKRIGMQSRNVEEKHI